MMRSGIGYDSHRLVADRPLILGGVRIPSQRGLLGHSDADVLVHAVCDAILGAAGIGDIGQRFPDTDPAYKDVSSLRLLAEVRDLAGQRGCTVCQIDTTIILEEPKLRPWIGAMTRNLADALAIPPERVGVKAKTNEGMGWIGRKEGAAALAVAMVREADGKP